MEVPNLANVQPSQSQSQTNPASSVAGTATDTNTIQSSPDNVVTPSAESDGARGDRRRDALGPQPEVVASALNELGNERLTNRRTQLGFNSELNRVFLEVVDTKTDEILETIPPEELVRFFSGLVDRGAKEELPEQSGAVLDQSV